MGVKTRLPAENRRARVVSVPALIVALLWSSAAHPAEWPDPPPVDIDACAVVNQKVTPNPTAPTPDSYVLVTRYAADLGLPAPGTTRPPKLTTGLIDTLGVSPQTGVGRTCSLVVSAPADDRSGSYQGALVDVNGDGRVDRAQVFALEQDEFGRLTLGVSDAPEDRRDALQGYFDDVAEQLLAAAGREIPDVCR